MKIIPINPTVNDYIEYLNRCEYPSLFDSECLRRIDNVSRVYGDKLSDEICLEILLDDERKSVDYSFLTKPENEVYKELWYELDYDSIKDENIKPCFFIDGSFIKSVEDLNNNRDTLIKFMGENRFNIIYPILRKCVEFLHENKLDIYQLGAMEARDNNDRIRLFPRRS